MKPAILAAIAVLMSTAPSLGACPGAVPGTTAEAIRINQERLICLQRELSVEADRRRMEMQMRQLEANQQRLEMERRLQVIQPVPPPLFPNLR